jgi:EAL domain-containing protein (putative c-di-GMP-specific phosphodiesterase class I)
VGAGAEDTVHDATWPEVDTHARVFLAGEATRDGPPSIVPASMRDPEVTLPSQALEPLRPPVSKGALATGVGALLGLVLVAVFLAFGAAPAVGIAGTLVAIVGLEAARAARIRRSPDRAAPRRTTEPPDVRSDVVDLAGLERRALERIAQDELCAVLVIRRPGAGLHATDLAALGAAAAAAPLAIDALHLAADGSCVLVGEARDLTLFAPVVLRALDPRSGGGARLGMAVAVVPLDAPDVTRALRLTTLSVAPPAGGVRFHDERTVASLETRSALRRELRRAIAGGEIRGAFQPLLDTSTRAPLAIELLVRWDHPVRGPIPPWEILALAEHHGVGTDLTVRLLSMATRWAAEWRATLSPELAVVLNAAGWQLADRWLPRLVAGALGRHGLPPTALWIDVDVRDVARADPGILRRLADLAALGTPLVLDGVADPAALDVTDVLGFHAAKIDVHALARGGPEHLRDTARAIGEAALARGLRVVAERIDGPAELALLDGVPGLVGVSGHALVPPLSPEQVAVLVPAVARR